MPAGMAIKPLKEGKKHALLVQLQLLLRMNNLFNV